MVRTLILNFHPTPEQSVRGRQLLDLVPQGADCTVHNVGSSIYNCSQDVIKQEQELVRQHDTIVFVSPLHWFMVSAVCKYYIDAVFENGFAYVMTGPEVKVAELAGKTLHVVITTGATSKEYPAPEYPARLFRCFDDIALYTGMKMGHTMLYNADEGTEKQAQFKRIAGL